MAVQTVYIASSVSGTCANPGNALGNTPTTWAGTVNANTSWTHTWAFTNPTQTNLATGTQSVTLVARKGSNTGNPSVQFNVVRGGTPIASSATTTVTSTTGQNITATWFEPGASSQDVTIVVTATAVGGSGSVRNSVQVSMATWVAQVEAPPASVTYPLAGTSAATSDVSGSLVMVSGLSGTVDAATAIAGSLVARSPVAGTSSAVSTTAGNLTVVPSVTYQLTGSISAVSTSAGVLAQRSLIAGSSSSTTATQGALISYKPGTGTSPVVSGSAGVLTARRSGAGTVAVVSTAAGSAVVAITGYAAKVYLGTWETKPLKVWNGTVWEIKPIKDSMDHS